MKKMFFAVLLAMLVVAALGTTVFADNGPHGGFSASTSDCASCHRIHSAQSADGFLLVDHDVYTACTSCHGDGVGAYTDVKNGVYTASITDGTLAAPLGEQGDAGQPLFGGGFEKVAFAHEFNGMLGYDKNSTFPTPSAATSTHSIEGLGSNTGAGTIWGAGALGTAPNAVTIDGSAGNALECTSCHDPHGNAGWTGTAKSASYRLLRYTPIFSDGFDKVLSGNTQTHLDGVQMADTPSQYWYTINSDITSDPSVGLYRSRFSGGVWTTWSNYITQRGDAAGRSYTYVRPALAQSSFTIADGAKPSSLYSCAQSDLSLLPVVGGVQAAQGTDPGEFDYNSWLTACGAVPAGETTFSNAAARTSIGEWCSTCHDRYAASSARSSDSGDAHYKFRHTSSGSSVSCVDCHAAHGTNAVMTNTNAEHPGASLTTGSILMKTDERSVCLKCHGTSVNFSYTATPVPNP